MEFFFYLFALTLVFSSLMVTISRNSVHAVLWLIFAFCNSAALLILIGAEFLALLLIVVYVGAVSVLFLFVIMMLDIRPKLDEKPNRFYQFVSIIVSLIMLVDFMFIILLSLMSIKKAEVDILYGVMIEEGASNVEVLASAIYSYYTVPFQIAGLILFAAMVASIILTIGYKKGRKKQDPASQALRTKSNSVELTKPDLNKGVGGIKYV